MTWLATQIIKAHPDIKVYSNYYIDIGTKYVLIENPYNLRYVNEKSLVLLDEADEFFNSFGKKTEQEIGEIIARKSRKINMIVIMTYHYPTHVYVRARRMWNVFCEPNYDHKREKLEVKIYDRFNQDKPYQELRIPRREIIKYFKKYKTKQVIYNDKVRPLSCYIGKELRGFENGEQRRV